MRDGRTGAARIRWQQLEEPGGSGWVRDGERFASFFSIPFFGFLFFVRITLAPACRSHKHLYAKKSKSLLAVCKKSKSLLAVCKKSLM
jgi:hypothetical protein